MPARVGERGQSGLWLFSVACALTVALVHVAFVTTRIHVLKHFTWTSRDIVWMAPVAYLALFLVAALPAQLLARLRRKSWGEALLAALGVWLLLLLLQKLVPLAAIVLALGAGVLLAGLWERAYSESPVTVRRAVAALMLLVALVAVSGSAVRWGPRMLARSNAAPSDAPNVLLLILDTVRAQSMSLYGCVLFDAHSPYEAPGAFRSAFGDGRRELDRYDGAIAYLDSIVHGVLAELQRRGELDRTIVVITSDHGELFGEHGFDGHGNTLYLPALRVPLVMRFPKRIPAGLRVTQPVSLRDLPATLTDLAGVTPDAPFPGTSLRVLWHRGNAKPSPVFSESVARCECRKDQPDIPWSDPLAARFFHALSPPRQWRRDVQLAS